MKKFILSIPLFFFLTLESTAQNVAINNSGSTANASAMLDVSSASKGVLIPRVSTTARKAIGNPATGLLVFDSTEKTLYMFDGRNWLGFAPQTELQRPATNFVYGPETGYDTTLAGYSVSMWDQFAAVGVPYKKTGNVNTGGVFIYKLIAGVWQYFTTLTPTGNAEGSIYGVSVNLRGNYLIVGAPGQKNAAFQQTGAAYIYNFNGTAWVNIQTITGTVNGNDFGKAVAISQFGTTVAIGEPNALAGIKVSGGTVNIYTKPGATLVFQTAIQDPAPETTELFGAVLAMSPNGNYVLVGAPYKTVSSHYSSGYVGFFSKTAAWAQTHTYSPPAEDYLRLGGSVAISDNYCIFSYGKKVQVQTNAWGGGLATFEKEVTAVSIDPVTEITYALSDNTVYDAYSSNAPIKIKKLALDGSNPLPTILSFFNKNYIVGNPSFTNMDKPYTGSFYLGIVF